MKTKTNRILGFLLGTVRFIVTYIFIPLILIGGIVVTIVIVHFLISCEEIALRNQLVIGLATSLFSSILAASSVISLFVGKTKNNLQKSNATISLINDFNSNYLDDFIFVRHSVISANQTKKYATNKSPFLDETKYPATPLPQGTNYAVYKSEIIRFSFLDLYAREKAISDNLGKYLAEHQDYLKNTVANQTVYSIFKQKRIKILNFFESMALGIGNKVTSNVLLKNQFYNLLNETIPLLSIFVYNEEGEECYPALRALLMKWFSEEKK